MAACSVLAAAMSATCSVGAAWLQAPRTWATKAGTNYKPAVCNWVVPKVCNASLNVSNSTILAS